MNLQSMDKKEFGMYYNEIRFGERTQFITVVCMELGGSEDQWRRKLLSWSRNRCHGKSLPDSTKDTFQRLIRNDFWKDVFENLNKTKR